MEASPRSGAAHIDDCGLERPTSYYGHALIEPCFGIRHSLCAYAVTLESLRFEETGLTVSGPKKSVAVAQL